MKIKKFFAGMVAAVMAASTMSIGASASGTAIATTTPVGTNFTVSYSFNVDGDSDNPNSFGNYCGQKGDKGLVFNSAALHTVTAGCNASTAIRFEVYAKSGTQLGSKVASLTIPKLTSTTTSITSYIYLPAGEYYVKFVSDTCSLTKYSSGCSISYVQDTFWS